MPISTCLSNGRPTNAIHGDILYETDTMRLIVYDTSQGTGNERWVFHDQSGYQFGTLNDLNLLNYAGGKVSPNNASPYLLSAAPEVHLDARFLDGLDSANNPASGTQVASAVNRASGWGGAKFIQYGASAPIYEEDVSSGQRYFSNPNTATRYLGIWESDEVTGKPMIIPAGADWTWVHISRHNSLVNSSSFNMSFPFNTATSAGGNMIGSVYANPSTTHIGWPAQGISNPPAGFTANTSWYSDQFMHGTNNTPRGGSPGLNVTGSEMPHGLFETETITDAEKADLLRNLWGLNGDNNIQLWIGRKESNAAIWYMNGAFKLMDGPGTGSINNKELRSGQPHPFTSAQPGLFYMNGDVFETLYFPSALNDADMQKILDYAKVTYNVGATTGTKDF
jgi:hypothetical protein